MALIFLIPILVCGYYYLTNNHIHKLKIKKTEGQQLYFKCAFHGFIFTIFGFSLTSILISENLYLLHEKISFSFVQTKLVENIFYSVNLINVNEIGHSSVLQESKRNAGFYVFFLLSFLTSLFLTVSWNFCVRGYYVFSDWCGVLNRTKPFQYFRAFMRSIIPAFIKLYYYLRHQFFPKSVQATIKVEETESEKNNSIFYQLKSVLWRWKYGINSIKKEIKNPLDTLLYESIENYQQLNFDNSNDSKLIMLTMSDRKVYIGIVAGFGKGNDLFSLDNETFYFVPIKSGYRNKYDLRVCITTDYSSAIKKAKEPDDIQIILNKRSIISACKFDDVRFKSFDKSPNFLAMNK